MKNLKFFEHTNRKNRGKKEDRGKKIESGKKNKKKMNETRK